MTVFLYLICDGDDDDEDDDDDDDDGDDDDETQFFERCQYNDAKRVMGC